MQEIVTAVNVPDEIGGAVQPADRLLSRGELAARLGVCKRSVDSLIQAHKIPVLRLSKRCVRFELPAVLAALR